MDLSLTNVINISVSAAQTGVGAYNTSNLALFSTETPSSGFGTLGYNIYLEPTTVGTHFGTSSTTYKMANAVFSQSSNILAGGGYFVVIPFVGAETLDAAITRTTGLVQYFGVMSTQIESQANMLAAAAVIQPLNKVCSIVDTASGSVAPGGTLDHLRSGSFTQTRGLFYGGTTAEALVFMASYMSKGLSTNFAGSNTTQTLHLKDLTGVNPDPIMTQTLLGQCTVAGVDCYPSLQGVAKIYCSGTNSFFDQVYNLRSFIGALDVAGFNYLATVGTKVVQTEAGMDGLKGAYRTVCEQYITNQYLAPGTWTLATTFGNLLDFISNIAQTGYYIFSVPVAKQSAVDRAARKAPLIQIAGKEAGSIHSSSLIININA